MDVGLMNNNNTENSTVQKDLTGITNPKKQRYSNSSTKGSFVDADIEASNDILFKPISSRNEQKQHRLRESQSLNSLSLFDISPLTERSASFDYLNRGGSGSDLVFTSGSELSDNDILAAFSVSEEEFLSIYSEKKRNKSSSSQRITSQLDQLEKEEKFEMMEAVESTLNSLGQRTKDMGETVERINKKHNKTTNDFRHLLEVIKEMRFEAQALLKRQDKIAKEYKVLESKTASSTTQSSSVGSTYVPSQPTPQRKPKTYDFSDDDDEPVIVTKSKVTKTYDYSSDEDEAPKVKVAPATKKARKSDGRTQSEIESDEEWERKAEEKRKERDVTLAAEDDNADEKKEAPKPVDNRTQSEIESDEEWEKKRETKKKEQEAALAVEDEPKATTEDTPKASTEDAPKPVDNRTQSEIDSDEEWEKKREAKKKELEAEEPEAPKTEEAPKPTGVDDRTQSEVESDEEWERQQITKKKQLEEERAIEFEAEEERIRLEALKLAQEDHDDDYDEEKARAAAAAALAELEN